MQAIIYIISSSIPSVLVYLLLIKLLEKESLLNIVKQERFYWGILFALTNLLGFFVWWWRYGVGISIFFSILCILPFFMMFSDYGLMASIGGILIKALLAFWIFKSDKQLRQDIIALRQEKTLSKTESNPD